MTNTIINKWKHTSLKDVLDLVIDHRGLTPKKLGSDWSNEGIKTISAMNIKNGKIVNPEQIRYINNGLYKRWMSDEIADGDVVMTSEAPLGEAYIIKNGEKYCLSQRLFALRPRQSDLNSGYLYYYLTSDKGKKELYDRSSGTTAQGIRQTELLKVDIPVPSLSSQEKIADILSSIDGVIQKTDQIIQKSEELKNGLMNELLTKGIGHKKFKKTKLGVIPEEWDVFTIQDLIDSHYIEPNQDGNHGELHPKGADFIKDAVPFLTATDIRNSVIDFVNCKHISQEQAQSLRVGSAKNGDVLLTHKGTIGQVAILETNKYPKVMLSPQVTYFRIKDNKIHNQFLAYVFQSSYFFDQFKVAAMQSTRDFLSITGQRKLLLAIPTNLNEQRIIASTLKTIDDKVSGERNRFAQLVALKMGLMQDIFSQKVVVN